MDYQEYIDNHILRCEASYRGGGIEIDLSDLLGHQSDGETRLMSAYQNYLGGGMLGRIGNSYNFDTVVLTMNKQKKLYRITQALNRYYHSLTNHNDEWESETYEHNQFKPLSAY